MTTSVSTISHSEIETKKKVLLEVTNNYSKTIDLLCSLSKELFELKREYTKGIEKYSNYSTPVASGLNLNIPSEMDLSNMQRDGKHLEQISKSISELEEDITLLNNKLFDMIQVINTYDVSLRDDVSKLQQSLTADLQTKSGNYGFF